MNGLRKVRLSQNFNLWELVRSSKAADIGALHDQTAPPYQVVANLSYLVTTILQPLRSHIGKPIRVNSGYRSPVVNTAVGGSFSSDHLSGLAADIVLQSGGKADNLALFVGILKLDLPFKQLIWEFGDDQQPAWVHVSADPLAEQPRKQVIRAVRRNGRTVYEPVEVLDWLF